MNATTIKNILGKVAIIVVGVLVANQVQTMIDKAKTK